MAAKVGFAKAQKSNDWYWWQKSILAFIYLYIDIYMYIYLHMSYVCILFTCIYFICIHILAYAYRNGKMCSLLESKRSRRVEQHNWSQRVAFLWPFARRTIDAHATSTRGAGFELEGICEIRILLMIFSNKNGWSYHPLIWQVGILCYFFYHREHDGTLGMVPSVINPHIRTPYISLLVGIYWVYPLLKGSLWG